MKIKIINKHKEKKYKEVKTEYIVVGSDEDIANYKGKGKRAKDRKEIPNESRTRHIVIYVLPNTPIILKIAIQNKRGVEVIYL